MTLNNFLLIFLSLINLSCTQTKKENDIFKEKTPDDYFTKNHYAVCTPGEKPEKYQVGDLPCVRTTLKVSENEKLVIKFVVTNKESDDPYEYGFQELERIKNGKIIEKLKLRLNDDAYWSEVPFVRIRKQSYLVDLDNDGHLEFAVFPFHPGSAIWMRARIYSLKDKIQYWGEGKYQFEGDTFVQLGCMKCSKFSPEECKKCY